MSGGASRAHGIERRLSIQTRARDATKERPLEILGQMRDVARAKKRHGRSNQGRGNNGGESRPRDNARRKFGRYRSF
jgi:hypothetical protein